MTIGEGDTLCKIRVRVQKNVGKNTKMKSSPFSSVSIIKLIYQVSYHKSKNICFAIDAFLITLAIEVMKTSSQGRLLGFLALL